MSSGKGKYFTMGISEASALNSSPGYVVLHEKACKELDVSVDLTRRGFVELRGRHTTYARVKVPRDEEWSPIQPEFGTVYIGKFTNINLASRLSKPVRVRKAELSKAKEVHLAPLKPVSRSRGIVGSHDLAKDSYTLDRRAVTKGDLIPAPDVYSEGLRISKTDIPLLVIATRPAEPVYISDSTELYFHAEMDAEVPSLETPTV